MTRRRFARRPYPAYALAGIMMVALGLRLLRLRDWGLWGDESWALYLVTKGLAGLTFETARDMHPPLYHYLVYGWVALFGKSELSVRLLSVLADLATIPLLYRLGTRLFDRRLGLLAALAVALSPFSVHYAQEARMYSWATFLAVLSCHLLLRILESPQPRKGLWLAYGLTNLAALYTLYSLAFLIVAQGVFLLVFWGRYRRQPFLRFC